MIQSAGIVVIDWNTSEPSVLCVRAYANWDFPKGKVDEGETIVQAAARELQEETGMVVGKDASLAGVAAPSVVYGKGKKTKVATYFIADRTSDTEPFLPVRPELGKPENDEYRWVPVFQLQNLMPPRLFPVVVYVQDWAGEQLSKAESKDA